MSTNSKNCPLVRCMTCGKIVEYGSNQMQKHREQEGNTWKGFELF